MDVKNDLQSLIAEALHEKASSIFLERANGTIARSSEDKESLAAAADKVGKMVALFIDEDLSKRVLWDMMSRIYESGIEG